MIKIYSEDIVKKCNDEEDYKIDLPANQPIIFELGKNKRFRISIHNNKLEIMDINGYRLFVIAQSGNVIYVDSNIEI